MFLEKYYLFLKRNNKRIIIFTLLVTILLGFSLTHLRVENISEKFGLKKDDPVRSDLKKLGSLFGSSNYLFLGIQSDSILNNKIITAIKDISVKLENLPGVSEVLSISTAEKIVWSPYFNMLIPKPKKLIREDQIIEADKFQASLRSSPVYMNNIVSGDLKNFCIIIKLSKPANTAANLEELKSLENKILNICARYTGDYKFYLAGMGLIDLEMTGIVKNDLEIFGPLSLMVSIILLLAFFRNIIPVAIAVAVSIISLVWSLSILSITGTPMSVSLSTMIPLILVCCIAYCVHYLDFYFINYEAEKSIKENRSGLIHHLLVPEMFAGLTTAAGFFSLMTSDFEGIQEVGLFIGIGVLFAMYNANVFLPALLFNVRPVKIKRLTFFNSQIISPFLLKLTIHNKYFILILFVIFTVAAILGITRLNQNTNHLNYIKEDEPIRKAYNYIDKNFGGTLSLDILVTSRKEDYKNLVTDTQNMENALHEMNYINAAVSACDILKMIDESKPKDIDQTGIKFNYADKDFSPEVLESIAASTTGKNLIAASDSTFTFRITGRVKAMGSSQLENLLNKINILKGKYFKSENVIITGITPYLVKSNKYIINSQLSSFSTSFIFVFLSMFLITFSFKLGLMAIIPNILPLVFIIGIMGWMNIALDISNVMIASIALGIIVDDTMHFLYMFRMKRGIPEQKTTQKLKNAFEFAVSPILVSSAVISMGFFSMGFSKFVPTSQFGILSAINIIIASVCELLLVPVLMLYFFPQKDLNT